MGHARGIGSGLAALAISFGSLSAFAQSPGGVQAVPLVKQLRQSDIEKLATSLGHVIVNKQSAGQVSLIAQTLDGLVYLLIGTACEPMDPAAPNASELGCYGLNIQVRYPADEAVTLEKVNALNMGRVAVSVWRADDTLGVSRLLILDGGLSTDNIKANLHTVLAIAPYIADSIWPPLTAEEAGKAVDQEVLDQLVAEP